MKERWELSTKIIIRHLKKIHEINSQKLLAEILKVKMKLPPEIIKDVFGIAEYSYSL